MRYASIALAAAMLMAGCGSPPDPPPAAAASASPGPAAARHNAADVEFARALIPHHRAGIAPAAAAAAGNPEARTPAEAIIVTQQDEVARLTGRLRTWGAAPPAATPSAPTSAATPSAPTSAATPSAPAARPAIRSAR